jgi:uncharacterized protein YbaA (DUF1428 family)
MITKKYDYKSLKRQTVNGKRHYLLEGAETYAPMPSVTTILSATKPEEDRKALEQWRRNVGHRRAQEISTTASSRGTRMHKYLEDFCATDKLAVPGSNPYAQQANKMASIVVEQGLSKMDEIWGVEVPLCHPDIYAGTTDGVGIHEGAEAIFDFKQSNKLKTEERVQDYHLQGVAYSEAHNILYGTNIRKFVIMICTADYQYQEFIIEGEEFDMHRRKWWKRVEEYFELPLP